MTIANGAWTAHGPSSRRPGVVVGAAVAIVATATLVVVLGFLAVDGRVPGLPELTLPGSGGGIDPVVAPDGSDATDPGDDQTADQGSEGAAGDDAASQAGDDAGTGSASDDPDVDGTGAGDDDPQGHGSGERADATDDAAADGNTEGTDDPDVTDDADDVEAPADDEAAEDEAVDDEPSLEELQQRLVELGYLIGPVDGRRGPQTVAAIMAFQRVHGLAVDGVVGPRTLEAFAGDPVEPTLAGGPDTRLEVDLDAQLLHVVEGGERIVTLQVSSGNGATYRSRSGGTARARTPIGEFEVERVIDGVRRSRLGTLYDPLYFYRGFAIHGSNSVPPYPASHGCVRITRADARWLIDRIEVGTPVHVDGGVHVFSPSG